MADEEQSKETKETKEEVKKKILIPLQTVKKIMKEEGIIRISRPALEEVRNIIQDILKDMSRNILIYTRHRKAKVSNSDDVHLSIR